MTELNKRKIKRTIRITLKTGIRTYKVSKIIVSNSIKYIRKYIQTPSGKKVSVVVCATLLLGNLACKSITHKIERQKAESKVEMYRAKLEELKSAAENKVEGYTVSAEEKKEVEVVIDTFTQLKQELVGFNVSDFIKDIPAKPRSASFKVLDANGISHTTASNGADHVQLNEELKIKIMDEIEKEFGRSAYRLFNPLDVTQISGLSEERFKTLLPENLKDISAKLYEAEHPKDGVYPINGLFLLAKTCLESANGTSRLAVEKHNLAGLGASEGKDNNGNGIGDIAEAFATTKPNDKSNPDWIAYGKEFSSKTECMDYLINKIRNDYINPNGAYYKGGTGESTGVSIFDINKKYCTMVTWSYKILDRIEQAEEQLGLFY